MTDQTRDYYIQRKAGDPWTVEDFHELQTMIKQDIRGSITTAIDELQEVDKAGDAAKFGGKTPDEYAQALVDRVLAELPKRTGYLMVFKDIKLDEPSTIEHKLGAFPLTDLYQLDYFRVIASEDEHVYETFTTFYLYHSSESKIRFRAEGVTSAGSISVQIDPEEPPPYRVAFERMLDLYEVHYDDDSSLGDLETDFWTAFLSKPNDSFDDDQYCHSPWFDRCCREMRTVRQLKQRGEWDDLWFVVRPSKTVNYYRDIGQSGNDAPQDPDLPVWAPNNVQVEHFDLNTLGLTLLRTPELNSELTNPESVGGESFPPPDAVKADHLKLMVLLKV
jgi:hypothetical protein